MDYDKNKVDEVILALLYLNAFSEREITRAWKSFDWGAMDRLYQAGYINNPRSKAKSVVFSEDGLAAQSGNGQHSTHTRLYQVHHQTQPAVQDHRYLSLN